MPTIFFCGADEQNESECNKFTIVLGDSEELLNPAKKILRQFLTVMRHCFACHLLSVAGSIIGS
ncbi:MAG: hypothetical protein AABX63_03325, partial [Nanoarchaeota archaeon]